MTQQSAQDFYIRQISKQVDKQLKYEMLRQQKANAELNECKFHPNITTTTFPRQAKPTTYFNRTGQQSPTSRRTFDEFLLDQLRHQTKRE